MSKILTIGTEDFEFPVQGDNPDWGQSVTDWATAVTDTLSTVQAPNDILITSAAINNNISSPTAIPGFAFDTSEVISINAEATVIRTTDSPAVSLVETFHINGNYDGSTWAIAIDSECSIDSGVELDINPAGQIVYTSTNLVGSNYSAQISFKAKVINQDS